MNRNQLYCSFGCPNIEDQDHIFTQCGPIMNNIITHKNVSMSSIDGSLMDQKEASSYFMKIEETRLHMLKHLLPGGACCQDPCKLGISLPDYAADIISS